MSLNVLNAWMLCLSAALLITLVIVRVTERPGHKRAAFEMACVFLWIPPGLAWLPAVLGVRSAYAVEHIWLFPVAAAAEGALIAGLFFFVAGRRNWILGKAKAITRLGIFLGAVFSAASAAMRLTAELTLGQSWLMLFAAAGIFVQALLAIEWRLAFTTVPRMLRGERILMISAGLLSMGLLGLLGLF